MNCVIVSSWVAGCNFISMGCYANCLLGVAMYLPDKSKFDNNLFIQLLTRKQTIIPKFQTFTLKVQYVRILISKQIQRLTEINNRMWRNNSFDVLLWCHHPTAFPAGDRGPFCHRLSKINAILWALIFKIVGFLLTWTLIIVCNAFDDGGVNRPLKFTVLLMSVSAVMTIWCVL